MKIPAIFTTIISDVFYDKTFTRYAVTENVDDDGFAREEVLSTAGTFKGNINLSKFAKTQFDYGLNFDADAVITTAAAIDANEIIGYLGKTYKVIDSQKYDSHYYLLLTEWSSKSST